MNTALLRPEIQQFICDHTGASLSTLAFQKNPFPDVDFKDILRQIESRTKSKVKLPTWFDQKNILYPTKVSIEQTSSEKTAAYKASLVEGTSLIDLTGGFGVDAFYFSKKINQVIHCESNNSLSQIAAHNFKELQQENIICYAGESESVLQKLDQQFDWIYLDPSRRNDQKNKVFLLNDCQPNVPELLNYYFQFTNSILVKTSPMLDIAAGISALSGVKAIHIVAVGNEVKEILWLLEKNYHNTLHIVGVNLNDTIIQKFSFPFPSTALSTFSLPLQYLYEPNAALMKSGGFDEISEQYQIHKLHTNSHLYTASRLLPFCGRVFEIEKQLPYSKENMKRYLENTAAHVTTRNFPVSVDELRKKWKIKEGNTRYCFFTTTMDNHKIVLLCNKIITE